MSEITPRTDAPEATTTLNRALGLRDLVLFNVVTELSSRFPQEGGIYQWTKRALGEKHGYVCGWCYWINNVLYYPNLLISTAVIATYVVGKGDSGLSSDWTYVLTATLVCLWLAVLMNIVGVG